MTHPRLAKVLADALRTKNGAVGYRQRRAA